MKEKWHSSASEKSLYFFYLFFISLKYFVSFNEGLSWSALERDHLKLSLQQAGLPKPKINRCNDVNDCITVIQGYLQNISLNPRSVS